MGIDSCAVPRAEEATLPRQPDSADARPSAQAQQFAELCSGAAFAIALLAELGWLFHSRPLTGGWGRYLPMAPVSALAVLLLSGGVFSQARWSAHRLSRRLALALAGLPALLGLLVLGLGFYVPPELAELLRRAAKIVGGN